jgi:hypothetical protein
MDMLFITANGRSTRFWVKLGEGFFYYKGIRVHGHIFFNFYSTWIIFFPADVAQLYNVTQLTWFI